MDAIRLQSLYKHFSNKKIDWLPMDTKELYEKNLKENYKLLSDNNWIDNPFTYKFNGRGFRSDEFTSNSAVMFFGCSLTIGIGIPWESTWSYLISKSLGLNCFNLGQGGASNDTAYRLASNWIKLIKPKIVVFMNTPGPRSEIIVDNKFKEIDVHYREYYNDTMFHDWISTDINALLNQEKNTLAIKQLCNDQGIKFVSHAPFVRGDYFDLARDLMHPGINSNAVMAHKILKMI
jgi:hypothetical protein